jgi:hypothetical protein
MKHLFVKAIIILSMVSTVFAQTATPPSVGDGTESNPYQITSLTNLYWISADSSNWDKHYIQTEDVNMSDCQNWYYYQDDNYYHYGWKPIGNSDIPFTGSYNGQFHLIDSLTIVVNLNSTYNQGLFGCVDSAEIFNIGLTNVKIDLDYRGENIGALIGKCVSSNIINCSCQGHIVGTKNVGGLIGYVEKSHIAQSFTEGSVKSTLDDNFGGIAGYCDTSTFDNCYSSINISISGWYPGLITGYNLNSTINKCYSTGKAFSHSNSRIYGLPGNNNFWLSPVWIGEYTQISYIHSMKSEVEMKNPITYLNSGWDFVIETENGTEDIWDIDTSGVINDGYPFLSWEHTDTTCFTDIEEITIPENYLLSQNYPNPFNPITAISYQLSAISDVNLIIFDISGCKINQWSYQNQQAGSYNITWNGTNRNGNPVSSGVYIYRMMAGGFVESRKMVLLK